MGLVGESVVLEKYFNESTYVNGVEVTCICSEDKNVLESYQDKNVIVTHKYSELINDVDAVYIASHPSKHYEQVKKALRSEKHVICESPIALKTRECKQLFSVAKENGVILMDSIKTAYSTAYNRLLLLLKGGKIGRIISVDATCTSLREINTDNIVRFQQMWNSMCSWGPTAMLPIFQILGTHPEQVNISSLFVDAKKNFDLFTKADFTYSNAVASFKVGKGVKSEGELVVSGTKGYLYVPAPWWKTDYFELRYENQEENKRYFYQLDGEGIRYEIVAFLKSIEMGKSNTYIDETTSEAIVSVIEMFENKKIFSLDDEKNVKK